MTKIAQIPIEKRPREKAFQFGISSLSDVELLALLLSSGTKNCSALDLAYELFYRYGSFRGLQMVDVWELSKIKGIQKAKASRIAAAFELLRRFESERDKEKIRITCLEDAIRLLLPKCIGKQQEQVFLILLNPSFEFLRLERLFVGTKESVSCSPKEILMAIIRSGASKVYIGHNHPLGLPLPSKADQEVSKTLFYYLSTCDIELLDSLIIGEKESYSILKRKTFLNEKILNS